MKENYLKIVLEALAEKIDRLKGEIFVRDMEIESLKKENEKLLDQNDRLRNKITELAEKVAELEFRLLKEDK